MSIGPGAGAPKLGLDTRALANKINDAIQNAPGIPAELKAEFQKIKDQFEKIVGDTGGLLSGADMSAKKSVAQATSAAEGGCKSGKCGSSGGDPMSASAAGAAGGTAAAASSPFNLSVKIEEDPLGMAKIKNMAKGGGAMSFERMVHEFMKEVVKEQQEKVKGLMDKMKADSAAADGGDKDAGGGQESRAIQMEELKFEMQQLTQMMQALSNVNNTMHQNAKNSIQAIRA